MYNKKALKKIITLLVVLTTLFFIFLNKDDPIKKE
jgi:hypothetical protein